MQVAYAPDKPLLFGFREKPEDPQLEPHAETKMVQVLGSPLYICGSNSHTLFNVKVLYITEKDPSSYSDLCVALILLFYFLFNVLPKEPEMLQLQKILPNNSLVYSVSQKKQALTNGVLKKVILFK